MRLFSSSYHLITYYYHLLLVALFILKIRNHQQTLIETMKNQGEKNTKAKQKTKKRHSLKNRSLELIPYIADFSIIFIFSVLITKEKASIAAKKDDPSATQR